ncbi:MAG: hypothetical protein CMJ33_09120 [Phycisphaerae bacterium]|nr:hypothetical protein [Phycisphaerae bacterium]
MSSTTATKVLIVSAALALPFGLEMPSSAVAQSGSTTASAQDPTTLMKDFLHYVRIAKPELAAASGQALLDSSITDEQLALLVADNDLEDKLISVLRRGRRMPGVEGIVAEMETRVEDGRIALARDPERINKAVEMLGGTLRQKMLAETRLVAAGEYAMPALLAAVVDGSDPVLEVAATTVIERIKRQAVLPLCAALMQVDPSAQRKICNMLGEIGYPTAEPFLLELADAEGTSDVVKDAAMRAFKRLGGSSTSVSAQFVALGRRFFDQEMSLVPWPAESMNNIWSYDSYAGLTPTAIATPIYSDVMAMKMAQTALGFDDASADALALFVASDLRRGNEMTDGMVDPIYGDQSYSPEFFATAVGPGTTQDVLAMGLDQFDTALVNDALVALGDTTGRANLFIGARLPLLECLRYPDRRVQYRAALVLANALPKQSFPGDDAVVPLLGSAVRDSGSMFGIVVASNDEDRRTYGSDLQAMGFTVLDGGDSYDAVRSQLGRSVGLDLVVVRGGSALIRETIKGLRNDNLAAAVPVIACANSADELDLGNDFTGDRATMVWTAGGDQQAFMNAATALLKRTGGASMDEGEALEFSLASLDALARVAASDSTVLEVTSARPALLEALANGDGHMHLLVADVLSMMPGSDAQQALIDSALAASDEMEQIDILDLVAASARRFGNQAAPRQVSALRDMIRSSQGDVADAAGRAFGALNVGPRQAVELILK